MALRISVPYRQKRKRYNAISIGCVCVFADKGRNNVPPKLPNITTYLPLRVNGGLIKDRYCYYNIQWCLHLQFAHGNVTATNPRKMRTMSLPNTFEGKVSVSNKIICTTELHFSCRISKLLKNDDTLSPNSFHFKTTTTAISPKSNVWPPKSKQSHQKQRQALWFLYETNHSPVNGSPFLSHHAHVQLCPAPGKTYTLLCIYHIWMLWRM